MKTNTPSQENSDQVVIISYTTDEDDRLQRGGQIGQGRSYECTFCKRGFSNAQALGGHMNIHRKDKAKLKQSSSTATPNIVQPKNLPSIFSDQESIMDHHATSTILRHDQSTSSTSHVGHHQRLPSFPGATRNENRESGGKGFLWSTGQEHVAMVEDDLDLELRLGHDPCQDDPSAATGMRKFL